MRAYALFSQVKVLVCIAGLFLSGCATNERLRSTSYDSSAKERAKPYFVNVEFSEAKGLRSCPTSFVAPAQPEALSWRDAVRSASACVASKNWPQVKVIGQWISDWHIDAPWGPYFLAIAERETGENLRASWLLELAEKKSGGPIAMTHFERARWLDREIEKGQSRRPAILEMKAALKLDPKLTAGWLWLAQLHDRELMESEAVEFYEKVLALDPAHKEAKSALNRLRPSQQAKGETTKGGAS